MQEYYILTLDSGQPIILYRETDKVYMYSVQSGRIRSQGIVFSEVAGTLHLLSAESHYVSYISTKGQLKLSLLEDMRFVEMLSLPMENLTSSEVKQIYPVIFKNVFLLFYLMHNSNDSSNSLFFVTASSVNKSSLVTKEDYSFEKFRVTVLDDEMVICLYNENEKKSFLLDSDMAVRKMADMGGVLNDNTIEKLKALEDELAGEKRLVFKLRETVDMKVCEINQFKESVAEKDNKIANFKKLLDTKKNEIADYQKKIYEMENEISGLKSTQNHITNQYNELADFAGQLQEELRKVRYL